jgi:hypothetical protein
VVADNSSEFAMGFLVEFSAGSLIAPTAELEDGLERIGVVKLLVRVMLEGQVTGGNGGAGVI